MTSDPPRPDPADSTGADRLDRKAPDPSAETAAASKPVPSSNLAPPVNPLTPEEQMALFEKELKENDWGHQPC
jgi:hypothetical protein